MRSHSARCGRGFSLVELLVVIAIIALIVSLGLPALAGAREASKASACLANMRTLGQAVVMYQKDYDDYYPLSSHSAGSLGAPGAWLQSLADYGADGTVRHCPSDPARDGRATSFATNDHFEPLTPGIDFSPITGRTLPGGRTRAINRAFLIPRPSATVYTAEAAGEGTVDHLHSIGWTKASEIAGWIPVERHKGGADYLFADGHASDVRWRELRQEFSVERNMFNPEKAY